MSDEVLLVRVLGGLYFSLLGMSGAFAVMAGVAVALRLLRGRSATSALDRVEVAPPRQSPPMVVGGMTGILFGWPWWLGVVAVMVGDTLILLKLERVLSIVFYLGCAAPILAGLAARSTRRASPGGPRQALVVAGISAAAAALGMLLAYLFLGREDVGAPAVELPLLRPLGDEPDVRGGGRARPVRVERFLALRRPLRVLPRDKIRER